MNAILNQKLTLFIENHRSMKGKFVSRETLTKRLAALLYAEENRAIDLGAIQESYELIKAETGLFSAFRGTSAMAIATMLSLAEDGEKVLNDALALYKELNAAKFWKSDYLAIAAYQIAANAKERDRSLIVERTRAFYEGMKAYHKFYTGQDDVIFAAMLGLSDVDVNEGVNRMESLFQRLRGDIASGNGLQALTQVLVLGGEAEDTVPRVLELREKLKSVGLRMDREYTLSSLGMLGLLPVEADMLVEDVSWAYEYLRGEKGFGSFSLTKQQVLLFAAALVIFSHAQELAHDVTKAALSTTITNIIIAQQAAIAVIAASTAATAAASSSSSS